MLRSSRNHHVGDAGKGPGHRPATGECHKPQKHHVEQSFYRLIFLIHNCDFMVTNWIIQHFETV